MKLNSKKTVLVSVILGTLLLSGCGKSSGPGLQSPFQPVPGAVVPGVPGGCMPVSAPIPFTGTNIPFDGTLLQGGAIPKGPSVGQVVLGGGGGGPYSRQSVDGTLQVNVIPAGAPTAYPYGTTTPYPYYPTTGSNIVTMTGLLQISAATQQDIMYSFGGNNTGTYGTTYPYPYNPYQPAPVPTLPQTGGCVSGIAFSMSIYGSMINDGEVWLYMNGTQHGYGPLIF